MNNSGCNVRFITIIEVMMSYTALKSEKLVWGGGLRTTPDD